MTITCTCQDEGMGACLIHGIRARDPEVLEQRREERKKNKQRSRSRIRARSDKQAFREGVLFGIKRERLRQQRLEWQFDRGSHGPGPYRCEMCGRWFITFELALDSLDLHHAKTQRSLGGRAQPGDAGIDDPDFLVLACNARGECHDKEHPGPQWSKAAS